MIKKSFFLIIFLLQLVVVFSQSSKNIDLLANFTFPVAYGELTDIWGYANGSGNEYALVGLETGVAIVDITTPTSPIEVFFAVGANSGWRDLKVWNDYVYIVNETSGGLMIIDMSSLPGGIVMGDVSNYTGVTYPFTTAHDIYIDENGIAYIMGADNGVGGAIILDLTVNPEVPVEKGRYNDFYIHDGMARGDTLWGAAVDDGFFFSNRCK